jgi:competence protein ComEA
MKSIISLLFTCFLIFAVSAYAGPVNINTANAETLAAELVGVGPKTAAAIVAYRKQHGPFKSASDLANVKGIGVKTLEKNQANIRISAK